MNVIRSVAGVLLVYVVFAAASMLLIGQVMGKSGSMIVILGLIGLLIIGAAAGFVAKLVAGSNHRIVGFLAAGLVVLATGANLVLQLGAEPTWYKIATLLLTAPAIVFVSPRASDGQPG